MIAREAMNLLEDFTALSYYLLLPLCFVLLYYSLRLFAGYLNHLDQVLDRLYQPQAHQELVAQARGVCWRRRALGQKDLLRLGAGRRPL